MPDREHQVGDPEGSRERDHDVVVFGATGFTGALTAQYLAEHADAGTRWALAGRNREKLERARETVGADVPLVIADTGDAASMRAMAESAKVVITTVGPYIEYGEPLVAACAAAGTAYVDLTGEPEFMDLMYVRHHAQARKSGARIIHACGFDSIPQDLGAHFTVQQLPEDVPIAIEAYVRAGGNPSGGTVASALGIMGRYRQGQKIHKERRNLEPATPGRRSRVIIGRPKRDAENGWWLLPMPTIDPQIVRLSAQADTRYGPDFSYAPYIALKKLPQAVGLAGAVSTLFTVAQLPPARKLISSRVPQGTGPSPEQREKGWFKVRFRGEGGGETVTTEVSGGDPGYGETSKMLAESALCLAHDDLPDVAGQVTTAQAMGDALRARLVRAGIRFDVL
ncbi:MAG: hypothetical protein QOI80_1430 [Solirubrobacteraceae bacterium]|nr:hypothetical protein [Solirubrobacteraceae bacterium]